jgi:transposase
MIQIHWSAAALHALRYGRFHPPDPRVPVRMAALYWRRQGVATGDIPRLCGMSKARVQRSLNAYGTGGIAQRQRREHDRPQRPLVDHRAMLEANFRPHPPATVAAAAAQITALTGIGRRPTQVRHFLHPLGRKPRTVGTLPAQAEVGAQEACTQTVWRPG